MKLIRGLMVAAVPMLLVAYPAGAQDSSIHIQCPTTTVLHPTGGPAIKCLHLSAGDGVVTMADDYMDPDFDLAEGKRQYIFSFSRLALPGDFHAPAGGPAPTDPAIYAGWTMDWGTLAANFSAPTIVADEDDEVYLNLTNVGMALRPDLSDPHTVHWHGFPNASAVFDGVPDASISINGGATLTYFYQPKDAGTYMYHCHVEATEHMQMGMLGNLYVRPRQNRCSTDPAVTCPPGHTDGDLYAYNDGDRSTYYDVEVPVQIGSFDPDFHDASYNVQPLPFRAMHDKYFMLNGRGYPDTTNGMVQSTVDPLGRNQPSQPVNTRIVVNAGDRVLLRISNLNVTRFNTLGTNGIPMQVIALDARLLRDDDNHNMYYMTHSVTLGGGQSADVILDTSGLAGNTYFLYEKSLTDLVNNRENFGGAMTEIVIN